MLGTIIPFTASTKLKTLLELKAPPFGRGEPFSQLSYIEAYLRNLGCRSVLLESRYVDRDFIEDHSLFYSRSFPDYPNYCRRLHFFTASAAEVATELSALLQRAPAGPSNTDAGRPFSQKRYLGFTVIKPLPGSPVGRTILTTVGAIPDGSTDRRHFTGIRQYAVHLGPIELVVDGLPFQQQDVGVSACATTALWSALHRMRAFEEIGAPTPAQITTLATQYYLPFGRPMPSDEGLSVENMCMALQALKIAPNLLASPTYSNAKAFIHASLRSHFAPILILQSALEEDTWHAVTVAGFRAAPTPRIKPAGAYGLAGDMVALYIHDDRVGPYQRVDFFNAQGALGLQSHYVRDTHQWIVQYVLIPMHSKIRVPLTGLFDIVIETWDFIGHAFSARSASKSLAETFDCWISRPAAYLQFLTAKGKEGSKLTEAVIAGVSMPRYIGVIRFEGPNTGTTDVLLDTTSTMKNLNFLGVVHSGPTTSADVMKRLAEKYQCPLISTASARA